MSKSDQQINFNNMLFVIRIVHKDVSIGPGKSGIFDSLGARYPHQKHNYPDRNFSVTFFPGNGTVLNGLLAGTVTRVEHYPGEIPVTGNCGRRETWYLVLGNATLTSLKRHSSVRYTELGKVNMVYCTGPAYEDRWGLAWTGDKNVALARHRELVYNYLMGGGEQGNRRLSKLAHLKTHGQCLIINSGVLIEKWSLTLDFPNWRSVHQCIGQQTPIIRRLPVTPERVTKSVNMVVETAHRLDDGG